MTRRKESVEQRAENYLCGHFSAQGTPSFVGHVKVVAAIAGGVKRQALIGGEHRPYERLSIPGIKGLTEAQKEMLYALGTIEDVAVRCCGLSR